ncbi:MAG: hypothetical protein ACOX9B_14145 [Candidatus Xenobium sp.]|nr:hypothetical protein [Burkholderiales bacterium]
MSAEPATNPSALHRPPSPLYRELQRKSRIHQGLGGIMEIDFGTGLFGIEFPAGGEQNLETELVKTSRRFPLAGVEKFQLSETSATETGRKVFYFDASGSFARGSGDLNFIQTITGRKRINTVKIRLEVE